MNKVFLKKADLQLINGGYLSTKDGSPVYNQSFVDAQRHAEFIVTYATMAKGKDFKGKKADSIEDLRKEVMDIVNKNKAVCFVAKPDTIKRPTSDKLAAEAMAFINFQESSSKVDKINSFLQQFKVLQEFEDFGLFFENEIVKLNKIYTLQEVIAAVTETIDLLG
jgi:TPP-dependent trihydroxycyclohexane-1,2-dione (THcHDO) dehydratase